jgi:hypothetical protein
MAQTQLAPECINPGNAPPTQYLTVKRLAKELGVPVAYLFCDDGFLAQCIFRLAKLSDEDKKSVVEQLSKNQHR